MNNSNPINRDKKGTYSQKKSLIFTAHCVLEPLTNER